MRTVIVFVLAALFFSAVFAQRAVEESDIEAFADILSTAEETEQSDAQSANPGFKYDSASACTSGPSKGAKALLAFIQTRFPGGTSGGIYNCRSVRGGSNLSLHGEGRAVDYMLNVHNAKQKSIGDAIVNFFTGNGAENAKRMGVQEVIWNRKIWSAGRPTSGLRDYTGSNPHYDHVHIGMNRWGAQNCC